MTRVALYVRVSTEEQKINGLSLDAQREALEKHAKEKGYRIVDIYADEGITARKQLSKRKELQRLLSDVKNDKIDLILVTKLDRWFRNIKDYYTVQDILEAHNCNWHDCRVGKGTGRRKRYRHKFSRKNTVYGF